MNRKRIELLESYIKKEPEDPFNKYALAMEYYEIDIPKARKIFLDLLEKHPDYLPTYFKAAHFFWDLENWDLASEFFTSGIELAEKQNDQKALQELKSAYQNFQFETE